MVALFALPLLLLGKRANANPEGEQSSAPAMNVATAVQTAPAPWCAPTLTVLTDRMCYYSPASQVSAADGGTLIIFLHSLVSGAPGAAWEQQQRMQRMADTYHFTMLVPQGHPGLGPGRDPNVLAWPTAQELQLQYEAELLREWTDGKTRAEALHGKFARVLLVGFSNGAYYASSIAFRERFDCDGVAIFAGGSGSKYQRLTAARAKKRVPIFVGYGLQDPDKPRQRQMIDMLRALGWPHRALAAKVGHTVASEQVRAALRYLGHPGL